MNYLVDDLFNDMFETWGMKTQKIPSVDILEGKEAFYIRAELAGYKIEDVKINVNKHVLHISSEKAKDVEADKDMRFILNERKYVKFDRSFALPENVDENGISAEFDNGVLEVKIPKMPAEKPKLIEVKIKSRC